MTVQLTKPVAAPTPLASVEAIIAGLASVGYIASRRIATALFMAQHLSKPVLVEGTAGVGKTELAIATATLLDLPLIRMQCYEGLDESKALYEWKYGKQLLYTQILKDRMGESLAGAATMEAAMDRLHGMGDMFFSEPFMEPRPILKALQSERGCVLLIDEIDKSDEAFEAFLLEVLADFQVTVPELGTVKAAHPPIVVITSNRTREIHDAIKRRCLYHWVGFPNAERELAIVRTKVPGIGAALSEQVVHFVQSLRKQDLFKAPGVAETLDWASALSELDVVALDPATVADTLGVLLKYQDDIARIDGGKAKELLEELRASLRAAE